MRAVWLVLVAGFRRQWRSWLLLGVLIAVASGFVLAAGIPLGIAAGRAIWRAFAISLGVVPVPVVQAWLIVALAAGALTAANDTDVLSVVRFRARSRATGKTAAMDLHHYFTFRDGKIAYYRGTEDTAQTQATLQP